ncbi:Core-2/I-branching beta-1 6-N-acetylglucosaminyltransferase family protein [Euphorbia peplus]|nr:Core-2/I-branching beta-1 6-N-acetylglucosaminyltransferase family protein [Euphorbia peplus]
MPKKTSSSSSSSSRHVIRFTWKLLVIISIFLCCFAFYRLHYQRDYSNFSYYRPRSLVSRHSFDFSGPPRVSFLFLVRKDLPLDFIWSSFFENAEADHFSIFIHSQPGFEFDEGTTRSRFFYGRQLENSIQVEWGEATMIAAERLLFAAALKDPANQRFVLLSDSCVPLYNFSYTYSYLMASPKSFVDSFVDTKEERYNPKMSPLIGKNNWRKGSQWLTLVRSHAEVIVADEVVFPLFQKYCKKGDPAEAAKIELNFILKLRKPINCIPDENYMPTLLSMAELEDELERRTLTYTIWNQTTTKLDSKGWHPFTFLYANASPQKIKEIKAIKHVYYESEHRTERCLTNLTPVPCFLFARKFSRGAAMRLLSDGSVMYSTSN